MANRIVLISDDYDFFEYIKAKLELRKSDELFSFSFDEVFEKLHFIDSAVLIINSENMQEKTFELLKVFKNTPVIVIAYNEDTSFRRKCYRLGMFDYMTLLTPDSEFRARMIPALAVSSILEKNKQYRDILVKNNVLTSNNEVFLDYDYILEKELENISATSRKAVFGAIAPNEKSKFLIQSDNLESVILNNIRKNDVLMSYAANKYFILMFDSDVKSAQKLWDKISLQIPEKVYAGFCGITNQKKQQLINEALNKLHASINKDKGFSDVQSSVVGNYQYSNFKLFRQEFDRKIEQVISPVFYQIQQKYSGKLPEIILEHGTGEGYGTFYIKGKYSSSCFRITSPGFSKINIDITYQSSEKNIDAKRITLEPEELESGLLEDLLEQFILDYKGGCSDNS